MDKLYWNGSSWISVKNKDKYWNGSSWIDSNVRRYWNGSSWIDIPTSPITYSPSTNLPNSGDYAENRRIDSNQYYLKIYSSYMYHATTGASEIHLKFIDNRTITNIKFNFSYSETETSSAYSALVVWCPSKSGNLLYHGTSGTSSANINMSDTEVIIALHSAGGNTCECTISNLYLNGIKVDF